MFGFFKRKITPEEWQTKYQKKAEDFDNGVCSFDPFDPNLIKQGVKRLKEDPNLTKLLEEGVKEAHRKIDFLKLERYPERYEPTPEKCRKQP